MQTSDQGKRITDLEAIIELREEQTAKKSVR